MAATWAGPAAHFPSRETARFHTSVLPRSHLKIFLGEVSQASLTNSFQAARLALDCADLRAKFRPSRSSRCAGAVGGHSPSQDGHA
eukprot:6323809-Amphidinium_carterae.2